MANRYRTSEERFWTKVQKTDSCWLWLGSRTSAKGYGQFIANGRRYLASRYSWELHNGQPIPDGLIVCHHCDNPQCVNPAHLFTGTYQDNMDDRGAKGRTYNGRAAWTHCAQGHEFTAENTFHRKTGRKCKTCFRTYQKDLKQRKKAIRDAGGVVAARYHPFKKA